MKFGFYTLGCKVNRFETQALMQLAQEKGHEIAEKDADVFIINTCTVTSVSDHKNIRAFHKIRRENPDAVIAACGCFAQMSPEKVLAGGEIDLVCGTSERADIIDKCEKAVLDKGAAPVAPEKPSRAFEVLPAGIPKGRTRALIKVQDGCDNYCSYCIIPYARGHVRSMPLDTVQSQVAELAEKGTSEIVLTGIEVSSYGADLQPKISLTELVDQVCTWAPGVRIRLSSLEPRTINRQFCETLKAHSNIAQHFHLSLQSGCDSVLSRMKRRYNAETFLNNVELLRSYFPDCSVTTDVITGFPGETEEEFAETLAFVKRCAFADMHVFPYSPREGTAAARMEGQLPAQVKAARAAELKALARTLSETYRARFTGRQMEVLLESKGRDGLWSGHSEFSFPIYIQTENGEKNAYRTVIIEELYRDGVLAKEI